MEAAGARPNVHTGELETPIFHGAGRRLPWLRAGAIAFAVLVVLWLAALVAGVVGFGTVPGLSLPGVGGSPAPVLHRAPAPVTSPSVRARLTGAAVANRHPSARRGSASRRTASATAGASTAGSSSRSASGTGQRHSAHRGSSTSSSSAATGGGALGGAITHGRRLGQSPTGTPTSPSQSSSSHRSTAPGQSDVKPGGGSPNSRANRTTALG